MRKLQPCSVCGAQVEMDLIRSTIPSDWEFRYSAFLIWYWEPGTDERHHCKLTPRVQMAYVEPEEREIPEPPVEPRDPSMGGVEV